MPVLVNDLLNIPHQNGQTVLHAVRNDVEVQVVYGRDSRSFTINLIVPVRRFVRCPLLPMSQPR
jgi:hypothetical protein